MTNNFISYSALEKAHRKTGRCGLLIWVTLSAAQLRSVRLGRPFYLAVSTMPHQHFLINPEVVRFTKIRQR
jgi:hypothetical protein